MLRDLLILFGPGFSSMSPQRSRSNAPINTPFELSINASKSLILMGDNNIFLGLLSRALLMLCHIPIVALKESIEIFMVVCLILISRFPFYQTPSSCTDPQGNTQLVLNIETCIRFIVIYVLYIKSEIEKI
jgi:hypothetical protein